MARTSVVTALPNMEAAPVPGSIAAPNIYAPVAEALAKTFDVKAGKSEARKFTVPANDASAHVSLFQGAARAVGFTGRKTVTTAGDKATVIVWLVPTITRPRSAK